MPIRKTQFAPGEHYHICIRGNNKQNIFFDLRDRIRMLFLIAYFQSPQTFPNIKRIVDTYHKMQGFTCESDILNNIVATRYVALEAFALMTNHVHIAVREELEGGITMYMQRVLTAYAKYVNTKYGSVGHVFQTPYRAVHVSTNEQLLYLSTYIHRNPRDLPGVAGREHEYEWSSYKDYLGENRFGKLLDPSMVLEQFESQLDYKHFVESSIAKEGEITFDPYQPEIV